jgi:hypothetical protein
MRHLRKDRNEIVLAEFVPGAEIEREGADGEIRKRGEEGFEEGLWGAVVAGWKG